MTKSLAKICIYLEILSQIDPNKLTNVNTGDGVHGFCPDWCAKISASTLGIVASHLLPVGNLHTCTSSPAISSSFVKLKLSTPSLPGRLRTHASLPALISRVISQYRPSLASYLLASLLDWSPGYNLFWHWSRLATWLLDFWSLAERSAAVLLLGPILTVTCHG